MIRFSIKTVIFLTSFVATAFGVALSLSKSEPMWAMLPATMYAGLIIAWCVYQEINEKKP
jgi:hypothetical protein